MSHELRTPLNSIIGMSELALENAERKEISDYIKIIRKSGNSLLSLINSILDYTYIFDEDISLLQSSFDIIELLENIIEVYSSEAHEKNLDIFLDVTGIETRFVVGDHDKTKTILSNIVANSVKFTEKGKILLQAESEKKDNDSIELRCLIRDTGIGLPPDKQEDIFKAFTQGDGSYTRKFGGSGLGLSIVKRLTDLLGGSIHVESEKNHGTEFFVTLPFIRDPNKPGQKMSFKPIVENTRSIIISTDEDEQKIL
jgi:signal transduction histidine kinase